MCHLSGYCLETICTVSHGVQIKHLRGMYYKWLSVDIDQDGDLDVFGTRGNSEPFDGVIWLEQLRSPSPQQNMLPARNPNQDSTHLPLP